MLRLFKLLVFLVLVGLIGLTGYAYLGDLSPETAPQNVPVDLDVQ